MNRLLKECTPCRARSGNLQEICKEIGSKARIGTFVRVNH